MKQKKNFSLFAQTAGTLSGARRVAMLLMTLLLTMTAQTAWAQGPWTSGGCDVTLVGGTLTVSKSASGDGAMADYDWDDPDWYDYREDITSIVIENGVTHIGNFAFDGCNNASLTTVALPASVTSIGDGAFEGCSNLTSIIIPASVTSIGNNAFKYCDGLQTVTFEAGSQLTTIGEDAFYGCSSLTSVTIPSSVTTIGEEAFYGCSSLESITIPASVTSIYGSTLNGCENLERINVDGNNMTYTSEDGVLFNKAKTTLVRYPRGKSETSYTIPASVTTIGDHAFDGCENLATVTLEEGSQLQTIGEMAFNSCSSLESFTIPASVTSIGSDAFKGCENLQTVTFEAGSQLQTIGEMAFNSCSSLESITIPASVTSIGSGAFSNTGWYNKQSEGLLYLGDWLLGYKGNKPTGTLQINEGTKGIAAGAFNRCNGLTAITIPASVTSIGGSAFYWCDGLTSITIPASVTSIGTWAFQYCSNLATVYVLRSESTITTLGDNVFRYCNENLTIVVPSAKVTNYKEDNKWSTYGSIVAGYTITCSEGISCTTTNNGPLVQESETVTLNYNNGAALPEGKVLKATDDLDNEVAVTQNDNTFSFTMPAGDVTVSLKKNSIPYIDADGNMAYCTDYTEIDGNEDSYDDAGWYVVKGEVSKESGGIDFYGEAHIILADDATLTLSNGTLWGHSHLTIYGQTKGNGTLNATNNDGIGICTNSSGNLVINGGIINATGGDRAIDVGGNLVINGGTVTGTRTNGRYGLYAGGTITINGGQVTATGWIYSKGDLAINGGQVTATGLIATNDGNITLGWTNSTDQISASRILTGYDTNTISIADGKAFTDGTNVYTSATPSDDLKTALTNVTLRPITGVTLTKDGSDNLTAEFNGTSLEESFSIPCDIDVSDVQFNRTFNKDQKTCICLPFAVDATTAAELGTFYQFSGVTGEGKIQMTEVTGDLAANTPYIFEPSSDITTGIDFGAQTLKAGGALAIGSGFTFKGIYDRVKWTRDESDPLYDADRAAELGKAYGFALEDRDGFSVGQFVKLGSGAHSRPFRAYLLYDGAWDGNQPETAARRTSSQSLPDVIEIEWISAKGETTGIEDNNRETITNNHWYSLDGRRLNGKPTQKGVYIKNGNKIVIKN